MSEPEHQCRIRSLAEPYNMSFGYADVSYDCGNVISKVSIIVRSLILRDLRGGIATGGVSDAAVVAREIAHLSFPFPMVGGELMYEDDRITSSGFFDVELYAIRVSVRHGCLLILATASMTPQSA